MICRFIQDGRTCLKKAPEEIFVIRSPVAVASVFLVAALRPIALKERGV